MFTFDEERFEKGFERFARFTSSESLSKKASEKKDPEVGRWAVAKRGRGQLSRNLSSQACPRLD